MLRLLPALEHLEITWYADLPVDINLAASSDSPAEVAAELVELDRLVGRLRHNTGPGSRGLVFGLNNMAFDLNELLPRLPALPHLGGHVVIANCGYLRPDAWERALRVCFHGARSLELNVRSECCLAYLWPVRYMAQLRRLIISDHEHTYLPDVMMLAAWLAAGPVVRAACPHAAATDRPVQLEFDRCDLTDDDVAWLESEGGRAATPHVELVVA
jgi:hypothetical protein